MDRVCLGDKLTTAPIAIGMMNLLEWGLDVKGLSERIKEYLDLGLSTYDVADIYGNGGCETLFG